MDYKVLENNLENKISIFDGNHCTSVNSSFTIVRSKMNDKNDKFEFSIFSINGDEVKYKGNFNNLNITLEEKQDTGCYSSIFYLKDNRMKDIKEIYRDKNQNNSYAMINPVKFGVYRVEFLNLANKASEYIEMVSDNQLKICDIFYSNKKQLIGKLIRNNKYGNFEVSLASGIDYVFMLGLASFFFCKDIYNNNMDCNKCSYDNVAKLAMPSLPIINVNEELKDRSINNNHIHNNNNNNNIKSHKHNKDKTICGILASILCCVWCCESCISENDDENKNNRNNVINDCIDFCFDFIDCCDCGDCDCGDCDFGDCGDCGDCGFIAC